VAFPLLIIPLAIYNMIAFLTPPTNGWAATVWTVPLPSGDSWTITFSDVFIAGSVILLMIELIKPARPRGKSVIDHLLSIIVLGVAVGEFVMVKNAASATLAAFSVMCLADLIGGIAISVRVSRLARGIAAVAPQRTVPEPAPRTAEPPARAFEPPPRPAEPTHFLPDVSPLRDAHSSSHPANRPHSTP
jgi:hypothetical protein